jgi:hypothetical protein
MVLESALDGRQHVVDTLAQENLDYKLKIGRLESKNIELLEEIRKLKDQLSLYESGATSGAMNGEVR